MPKTTSIIPAQNLRHGWHLFRNRKTLWQMMREVLKGSYRMSFVTTIVVLFSIAYIIFPFDLIPDYIPVIGWIDDGLVFYLMLRTLVRETQRYNRHKASSRRIN